MSKSIDAATLRHRVRFDRLAEEGDSGGFVQDQETGALLRRWVPIVTVWAAIEPLSVRELNAAGGTQSETSARIVIRYNSQLTDAANKRAVHIVNGVDSVVYDVQGPQPDKDSGLEYLTFPAKAGSMVVGE